MIQRLDYVNFQKVHLSNSVKSSEISQYPVGYPSLPHFERLVDWLQARVDLRQISVIGHRIVHGGNAFRESTWLDENAMATLKQCVPLAPNHLPGEIELIEHFQNSFPEIRQAACFDTAFHADLPQVAALLPIPRRFQRDGLRRFGFHGISYAYLMSELQRLGSQVAEGNIVLAHLGNGASMAAIQNGHCIDTSMCLTPTAGLVMGTRTGDLDPGILLYLMRESGLNHAEIDHLVTRESGLLGLSETTSDMQELLHLRETDARADEAVSVFCYQAKKQIGAYLAALGGLDTLVFSGGIGERSAEIREEICRGLSPLGISLDQSRNRAQSAIISSNDSRTTIRVIETNEEFMIAQELLRLLRFPKFPTESR